MVDAINGNYSVKPQDTSINWNDLTANEVLEYEDEGQEVPEEVLAWAQDMAKTDNADDVTYEMSTSGEEQPQNAAQQLREEMSNNGVSLKQQGRQFIEESKNKEDLRKNYPFACNKSRQANVLLMLNYKTNAYGEKFYSIKIKP